jgi:DNA-binding response OmpR family regulator
MRQRLPLPVVLFADRDLTWSRIARGELRRRGAVVTLAESVDDAFHQAALLPPDVVILDEDLNGRGDRDLVDVFRAAIPRARIILLQADGSDSHPAVFASGPRSAASDLVQGLAQGALGSRLRDLPKVRLGTVLCVDDDPTYLRSIARLLSRRGYQVSAFEDADRALDAIDWLRPDVALVDIMLPGMGGLDLAEKIREKSHGRIPVVFLTGLDSDEAYYEGHQHGAAYLVEKTEAPQKVLDVVDCLAGDLDPQEREDLKSRLGIAFSA